MTMISVFKVKGRLSAEYNNTVWRWFVVEGKFSNLVRAVREQQTMWDVGLSLDSPPLSSEEQASGELFSMTKRVTEKYTSPVNIRYGEVRLRCRRESPEAAQVKQLQHAVAELERKLREISDITK